MIINIMDRCRPDGGPVLDALRRLLGYRVSIGELIIVAVVLGIDLVVSFLGAIVSWPVLLVADVGMT